MVLRRIAINTLIYGVFRATSRANPTVAFESSTARSLNNGVFALWRCTELGR